MYMPTTGRFNRLDDFAGDVFEPQSLHKYAYVHDDPVNFTDPTGQFEGLVGLLANINIQSIGRKMVNTYSLGAKVWAQRMAFSVVTSAFIQFYA